MKFKQYLNESVQRYAGIYKAKDKKWYLDLADDEYGEYEDSNTYGPFVTQEKADEYLDNFSNPGGMSIDRSGKQKVPKKSPNGSAVEKPRKSGGYF